MPAAHAAGPAPAPHLPWTLDCVGYPYIACGEGPVFAPIVANASEAEMLACAQLMALAPRLLQALEFALPFALAAWQRVEDGAPKSLDAYRRWQMLPEVIDLRESLEAAKQLLREAKA